MEAPASYKNSSSVSSPPPPPPWSSPSTTASPPGTWGGAAAKAYRQRRWAWTTRWRSSSLLTSTRRVWEWRTAAAPFAWVNSRRASSWGRCRNAYIRSTLCVSICGSTPTLTAPCVVHLSARLPRLCTCSILPSNHYNTNPLPTYSSLFLILPYKRFCGVTKITTIFLWPLKLGYYFEICLSLFFY